MIGRAGIYSIVLFLGGHTFAANADPTIFRCEVDGTVTYSDTACTGAPEKTAITDTSLNGYSADEPTHRSKSATPKKIAHHPDSIAEEQIRHKERCKELADQIDAIATKLWNDDRGGRKHAGQVEKLRDKQKKLERTRRTEKCH